MLEIAVDIGGTFTDIVCLQDQQHLFLAKVPTTPHDLVQGVQQGVSRVLALAGQPTTTVERFIHSTTIATNAILEQKGAITGVLITTGFEDVLEIGQQKRSQMYDLFLDPETPSFLAPRRQRVGIRERLDAQGNILQPLDEPQVIQAVGTLQQLYGVQSVAVCYLFSFINPAHELRTRELIVQNFPGLTVSLSSEIDPVFREYERVCVTAFDAYARPIVAVYMQRLAEALSAMGIRATLQVMQSRGGLTSVQTAMDRPVTMLLSGPASGVIGGRFAGEQSELRDLITLDIGGTSCDVALVREGKPLLSREGRIARYPLRVPMVDASTVCRAQAVAAFHAAHQQVYGHNRPTHPVEFVNLRSVHSAPLPCPQLTMSAPSGSLETACQGMRPVYFDEYQAYRDTPIYQRALLPLGAQFDGPAIVEQPDTTTVVYPGFTCRVDDVGNLLLTLHTR